MAKTEQAASLPEMAKFAFPEGTYYIRRLRLDELASDPRGFGYLCYGVFDQDGKPQFGFHSIRAAVFEARMHGSILLMAH